MIHALKQLPEYFKPVVDGIKGFEVRKNDRPFQVGDLLALNEWDAEMERYTGRSCLVHIDYILNDEAYCKEGYVILGIKPCSVFVYDRTARYNPVSNAGSYKVPLATEVYTDYVRLKNGN